MIGLTAAVLLSLSAVQTPEVKTGVLDVQRTADAAGDRRLFVSETELAVLDPGAEGRQINRLRFEIETLAAAPGGLTLRYRLLDASLTDSRNPGLEPLLKAWVGVDVAFSADASGRPIDLMDWPSVRDAYAARLQAVGLDEPARVKVLGDLEMLPAGARVSMILGDMALLADMQPRRPVTAGRFDQPFERQGDLARSATLSVSPAPDGCGLSLTRSLSVENAGGAGPADIVKQDIYSTLHVIDGWSSEVTRKTTTSGRVNSVETVRVFRDPRPTCPAS